MINRRALNLIKAFEGFEARAYQDPVGVWTIGYGHTAKAGPPRPAWGMRITRDEAEDILRRDLAQYEKAVDEAVTVPLNGNQRGALVSFCYNVGPANFRRSSVLRYLNQGRYADIPARLTLWNKAGGRVLRGLTRRRAAEGELFMRPASQTERAEQTEQSRQSPADQRTGKPAPQSTTIWSAIGAFVTTLIAALQGLDAMVAIPVLLIAALFGAWIIRERILKAKEHAV